MTMPPDIVDAISRIEAQTFVRQVDWFSEIGSTNDYALSIASDLAVITPRLVWADRQQAGRGRSGNSWWAGGGALTFSLLIERQSWSDRWTLVSLVTGLAIAEALSEFVPQLPVQVKWPNDVYLAGKKVCGILIEPAPGNTGRLVVGIGINVANSFRTAPADLQQTATALCDQLPRSPSTAEVLLSVLQHWERERIDYCANPDSLLTRWTPRCYLSGKRVQLTAGEASVSGLCRGIDDDGCLLIETASGLERRIAGTVRVQ